MDNWRERLASLYIGRRIRYERRYRFIRFAVPCGKSLLARLENRLNGEWVLCLQTMSLLTGATLQCVKMDHLYACKRVSDVAFLLELFETRKNYGGNHSLKARWYLMQQRVSILRQKPLQRITASP